MAYNEKLAAKLSVALAREKPAEKKMFGGLTFMVNGKMCCGILKDDLIVRVGKEDNAKALARPHSRPMDFTGKPMAGFIYVDENGWSSTKELKGWLEMGLAFAKTPEKAKRKAGSAKKKG